jgi:hypothetical protein
MESTVEPQLDADDLIGYGTAVSFLIWLTGLLLHCSEQEEAA